MSRAERQKNDKSQASLPRNLGLRTMNIKETCGLRKMLAEKSCPELNTIDQPSWMTGVSRCRTGSYGFSGSGGWRQGLPFSKTLL